MKTLRNIVMLLSAAFVVASCANQQPKEVVENKVDAIEVSVDSLLSDASALDGKTVKFTATVDHACMHGGKRLTVFGAVEGKTLKVEGNDKVQKFESDLMGKKVEVIGVVKKVPGSQVADCETDEGNEVPEFAFVVDCISYKPL